MKKFSYVFSILAVWIFSSASEAKELNVLCIGNSFTRNATKFLPEIVKSFPDCKLKLAVVYHGGASLRDTWNDVDISDNNPDKFYTRGRVNFQPECKTLKDLLTVVKWDVVVTLQQYGPNPARFSDAECEPYATNLYNYVKKYSPNSEIMVHQTWAYRPDWSNINRGFKGYQDMYDIVTACHVGMARKFNIKILPSGTAMKLCQDKHPFIRDPDFDYKKSETEVYKAELNASEMPKEQWSMHVGPAFRKQPDGTFKFIVDCEHAGIRGEYMMGCLWFEMLFGKDARTITFKPEVLNDEEAKELRNLAHETATTFVQPKDAK